MEQIIKGKFISRMALAIGIAVIIVIIYMQLFEFDKLYTGHLLILFCIGVTSSAVPCVRYIQLKEYLKSNNLKKIPIKNEHSIIFYILSSLAFILFWSSFTKHIYEFVLISIIVIANYIFLVLPCNDFHMDKEYIYYAEFKARIKEIEEIEDSHRFTVIIKGKKWTMEIKCSNYELQQNLIVTLKKLISQI